MTLLGFLTELITGFISAVGYIGVFILMALESTATPVPSELVMPFAGYLASKGQFSLWTVTIVGALGCLFGSLVSYCAGRYLGIPFIKKYGKYIFLTEADLNWTIEWFNKKGDKTIFISRFIPVVRHLISIPAGVGKMNIAKFSIYTFAGSFLWVYILAYAGYAAGENWEAVRDYTEKASLAILALLIIIAAWYAWRHIKHFRKPK
ncbi:DedA family protein [Candidatus Woesearchaeota archaeon]|nr:DedA family protein [Candidatus Woesearchaeota archaeon]